MLSVSKTLSVSSLLCTICSSQGRTLISLPMSATSGEGVPFTSHFPEPYSLWSIPSIPTLPSLAQSNVGKPMIPSQLCMFDLESNISPNPVVNLVSNFRPSSCTLVGSTIMSSMGNPSRWNWYSGASVTPVKLIGIISPLGGVIFYGISNVLWGIPFLGVTHAPRSSLFLGGSHISSDLPFL